MWIIGSKSDYRTSHAGQFISWQERPIEEKEFGREKRVFFVLFPVRTSFQPDYFFSWAYNADSRSFVRSTFFCRELLWNVNVRTYHVGFESQRISRSDVLALPIDVPHCWEQGISVAGQSEEVQMEAVRLINDLDHGSKRGGWEGDWKIGSKIDWKSSIRPCCISWFLFPNFPDP